MVLLAATLHVRGQTAVSSKTNETMEETCVVSGLVVRKADGVPLKGATVQLVNGEDREHTIATKTGTDGRFKLRNVPAGQYRLSARKNGYVNYEYGQKKANDPGATFTLKPGQTMQELTFKMGRAGVLSGKILDEDGEPMSSALVLALRQVYKDGKKEYQTVGEVWSNDLGEYRIHGLAPGRYFVSAQPQMWERVVGDREYAAKGQDEPDKDYAKIYYPNAAEPGKATSVEVVEEQETTSVDFLMKEVVVHRIRGRVLNLITKHSSDRTGLQVLRRNGTVDWDFVSAARVEKSEGKFEIPNIVPGEYTVLAYTSEDGKEYTAQEDVDVVNADVEGVVLAIGAGIEIPGIVFWDGKISLGTEDERVFLESTQSGHGWGVDALVKEGQIFTLKDVPQGFHRLSLKGLSKDCYVKEIRYGERVLADDVVRVGKGAAGAIEITVSSRGARLRGVVTSNESLPMAGVWVVAVPEASKRDLHRLFKVETTDQNGRYQLRGLAPGKYKLFSWDGAERGEWEDEDFLKKFEDKGVTVEVADGDAKGADLNLIQLKDTMTKSD